MKEFAADKQFTDWLINLDQWHSYYTKNKKHKRWVLTEEKPDDIGTILEHKQNIAEKSNSGDWSDKV
jgi:hypothetical protein